MQQVRVNLVKNSKFSASGRKSYVHALRKYGIAPTKEGPYFVSNKVEHQGKFGGKVGGRTHIRQHVLQKKDTTSGSSGDVPAEDVQDDSEYLAPVSIGTPAQTLNLDFDTGSADLWVWSTEIPQSTLGSNATGHTIFDSTKSSTFKASSGETWQIQYGDNSTASGDVGTDVVKIGNITIQNQAIELAKQLSTQFLQGAGDGLLGLAFGSINTVQPTPVQTPVENMISQQDIPSTSELFTAWLGSSRDSSAAQQNSFYTFGFIDPTALASLNNATEDSIHYTPVDNSQGFWMFSSTSSSVNGTPVAQSGNTAIADTGTTLALVADAVVEALYAAIPGAKYDNTQQGYLIPTSTSVDSLPTFSVDVGGQQFVIQKEDLLYSDAGNGMTYGGVQSRGSQGFDILGDTFLKSVYAVFDQGNTRFGVVQRGVGARDAGAGTGIGTGTGPTNGGGSGSGSGSGAGGAGGSGAGGAGGSGSGSGSGGASSGGDGQGSGTHHHSSHHHHHHHHGS